MKTFKTPKGTELPIMAIQGKDYLQAAPRIVWFREERENWGIETEFLSLSPDHAVCRATIRDEKGRIIAQATSMETKQGFESFVEKAETCAVSRAASFCNFGTLMAQELEEQGRLDEREQSTSAKLAEAPQSPKASVTPIKAASDPGSYVLTFGKFNGMTLEQVGPHDINGYCQYLVKSLKPGQDKTPAIVQMEAFLASRETTRGVK
jgi:hypothetical protein